MAGGVASASPITDIPAGNLTGNPSFEQDVSGWAGWRAALSREAAADAPHGRYVTRVMAQSTSGAYSIDDRPDTFTGTVSGKAYVATAWVKGNDVSAGQGVTVNIRERNGTTGAILGSASAAVTLS